MTGDSEPSKTLETGDTTMNMRDRLRTIWHVLRGRPVVAGCSFRAGRLVPPRHALVINCSSEFGTSWTAPNTASTVKFSA